MLSNNLDIPRSRAPDPSSAIAKFEMRPYFRSLFFVRDNYPEDGQNTMYQFDNVENYLDLEDRKVIIDYTRSTDGNKDHKPIKVSFGSEPMPSFPPSFLQNAKREIPGHSYDQEEREDEHLVPGRRIMYVSILSFYSNYERIPNFCGSLLEGFESLCIPAFPHYGGRLLFEGHNFGNRLLFQHLKGGQTFWISGGGIMLQLCGYHMHADERCGPHSLDDETFHKNLNDEVFADKVYKGAQFNRGGEPFPVYVRWKAGQMYEAKDYRLTEEVYTVSTYMSDGQVGYMYLC